jgi:hypothetical protein
MRMSREEWSPASLGFRKARTDAPAKASTPDCAFFNASDRACQGFLGAVRSFVAQKLHSHGVGDPEQRFSAKIAKKQDFTRIKTCECHTGAFPLVLSAGGPYETNYRSNYRRHQHR